GVKFPHYSQPDPVVPFGVAWDVQDVVGVHRAALGSAAGRVLVVIALDRGYRRAGIQPLRRMTEREPPRMPPSVVPDVVGVHRAVPANYEDVLLTGVALDRRNLRPGRNREVVR